MRFLGKIRVVSLLLLCSLFLSSCTYYSQTDRAEEDFRDGLYKRSFARLWWPATLGNARAQYLLAYQYYYGIGVVKDQDIARIWFRRSARKNYIPAVLAYRGLTNPRYPQYVPFQESPGEDFRSSKIYGNPINKKRKFGYNYLEDFNYKGEHYSDGISPDANNTKKKRKKRTSITNDKRRNS
jgi:TPR repeat protein